MCMQSFLCNRKLCSYYIFYSYGDEENDKIKISKKMKNIY